MVPDYLYLAENPRVAAAYKNYVSNIPETKKVILIFDIFHTKILEN